MTPRFRLFGAALLCAALCGCPDGGSNAAGEGPKGPASTDAAPEAGSAGPLSTGVGGTSPEDCFLRMKAANDAKDWGAYHDLLTKASQDAMLPTLSFLGGAMSQGDEAAGKAYAAILTTHGLENLSGEQAPDVSRGGGEMNDLFKDVKDRKQLFADLMGFAIARRDQMGDTDTVQGIEGITVDGDEARAQIVAVDAKGKELRDPARFRKVDGRWFAEIDMQSGR